MNRKTILNLKGMGAMMLVMALPSLLFSCASDGYDDDERFDPGVHNTTLQSPNADDITIEASADGSKQTITWPVVYGAGGYEVTLKDVTDNANPVVVDSLENDTIDGTSVTVTRTQDTNYELTVKSLGNDRYGNATAESATVKSFTSFTKSYAEIPDGTDLVEYFNANPAPVETEEEVCYDLVAGGKYTVSGELVLGTTAPITLRCMDKANKAVITFTGENATFTIRGGFSLKSVDIDADASKKPLVSLDPDYSETGTGDFRHIKDNCYVGNCKISNLHSCFLYDNKVKYCLSSFTVDDCVVTLKATESTLTGGAVFYMNKGNGFVNTLTVKNSTFSGDRKAKYFVQWGSSARADRAGYTSSLIAYQNCTFYKANGDQWGNYNSMAGNKTANWEMTNCIFVDCGKGDIARRFLGGRGNQATATFGHNTYWYNGASETGYESYDNSGTVLTTDPALVNPDGGDFTPTGAEQVANKTGDPRWLGTAE